MPYHAVIALVSEVYAYIEFKEAHVHIFFFIDNC